MFFAHSFYNCSHFLFYPSMSSVVLFFFYLCASVVNILRTCGKIFPCFPWFNLYFNLCCRHFVPAILRILSVSSVVKFLFYLRLSAVNILCDSMSSYRLFFLLRVIPVIMIIIPIASGSRLNAIEHQPDEFNPGIG